ncbi:hypothetical protein T459_26710 [Capsicum annuum]|uniref:Uncharacterized protein n=1 Tax=Capsicum annuum TaxID=4072 RepID=A0A2G2YBU4_CAPAN|nr:hypothetical protein T459_26710 [Capsicum annuum]
MVDLPEEVMMPIAPGEEPLDLIRVWHADHTTTSGEVDNTSQHKAGGNSRLQADELILMDSTVSGYDTTSLFSKAVWVSINPLLSTGYQSPLKLDEVPLLPPDFQVEFRICSMRLMKLPKMLNRTWSIMPELRSSLPRSRQSNTTNKNKQKLPVVLPSPASTSQVHNGSNHAKVYTQQEKLNSSLELLTHGNISTLARCKEISSPIYIQISFREGMRLFEHLCSLKAKLKMLVKQIRKLDLIQLVLIIR